MPAGGEEQERREGRQRAQVVAIGFLPDAGFAAVFATDDAVGLAIVVQHEVQQGHNAVGLEIRFEKFAGGEMVGHVVRTDEAFLHDFSEVAGTVFLTQRLAAGEGLGQGVEAAMAVNPAAVGSEGPDARLVHVEIAGRVEAECLEEVLVLHIGPLGQQGAGPAHLHRGCHNHPESAHPAKLLAFVRPPKGIRGRVLSIHAPLWSSSSRLSVEVRGGIGGLRGDCTATIATSQSVSQDGQVRIVAKLNGSLVMWDEVKLLDDVNFSPAAARDEVQYRMKKARDRTKRSRGYTQMPKTMAELMAGSSSIREH